MSYQSSLATANGRSTYNDSAGETLLGFYRTGNPASF